METVSYRIRRSDRARRVRVTVDAEQGVVVVLPRRCSERRAQEAVRELTPWIERRWREVGRVRDAVAARGDTVPYLGRSLTLVRQSGRSRVALRGDALLIPNAGQAECREAIERWYRRRARTEVASRLDAACAASGLAYTRLTIRGQRTRWASCSRTGTMSFNWRLLLAPEAVLEYIVWHEVCHLRVMDHSPRFWALVATHCPDHREHSAWLRRHGSTLVL